MGTETLSIKGKNLFWIMKKHQQILGITDISLSKTCMKKDETQVHVLLKWKGVSGQRKGQLSYSSTFLEKLSNLNGFSGFWRELGWLEWSSREPYYAQRRKKPSKRIKKRKRLFYEYSIVRKLLESFRVCAFAEFAYYAIFHCFNKIDFCYLWCVFLFSR